MTRDRDSDNDNDDRETTKIIYRRKHEAEIFGIPIPTLLGVGALAISIGAYLKSNVANGNGDANPKQAAPTIQYQYQPAPAVQPQITEEQQRQNEAAEQQQRLQEAAAQIPPSAEFSMNSIRDGVYKRYRTAPKSMNGPFMTVA